MHLSFKTYLLDGECSIANLPIDNRQGIYVYTFSDGSVYVGKSVNVVNRHSEHLHEYRHDEKMAGLTITKMEFAEVEGSAQELDDAETKVISEQASKVPKMRNKQKMNVPYSADPNFSITFTDDITVYLPLDRKELTQNGPLTATFAVNNSHEDRFARFSASKDSDRILSLVRGYVQSTIPEFRATAGKLWTITAYPSTGKGNRKLTVCSGNIETLVLFDNPHVFSAFVNLKEPFSERRDKGMGSLRFSKRYAWLRRLGCKLRKGNYPVSDDVINAWFSSTDDFANALSNERFLDWCYCLNVEMLRKCGSTMYGRFNNMKMVEALCGKLSQRTALSKVR